jgi:hypothetical protein
MTEYLLELYIPRSQPGAVVDGAERAGLAAEQLRRAGSPVRYLRSIFVPEDETCFLVYNAGCADDVRQAARLAGLPTERILTALAVEARGS